MIPFWPTLHGHTVEFGFLQNALSRGNVAHALVFHGPEAVGKRVCALHFANMLFAKHNPTLDHQSLLQSGRHPDFHFIEKPADKKDISVDQVRELLSRLKLKSYHQGAIIAVIDDAHLLNKSASNALLKTLEEPNPNTYLLLISDRPHLLLTTIASRCQAISFGQLAQQQCQIILKELCSSLGADDSLAQQLLHTTEGSLQTLALNGHIQRQSNAILDVKSLAEHLAQIAATVSTTKKNIERIIDDFESSAFDKMITDLANIDMQHSDTELFWQILRNTVRSRMKAAPVNKIKSWAKLLQGTAQAEYNIERRSANAQLQLASIFLDNKAS